MAKKRARRERTDIEVAEYRDDDGNVLVLRTSLTGGTIRRLRRVEGNAAASVDDLWHRRMEVLFERLAVSWTVAEMPITDQKMLLGRYRLASSEEQRWVRETIERHVTEHIPELG